MLLSLGDEEKLILQSSLTWECQYTMMLASQPFNSVQDQSMLSSIIYSCVSGVGKLTLIQSRSSLVGFYVGQSTYCFTGNSRGTSAESVHPHSSFIIALLFLPAVAPIKVTGNITHHLCRLLIRLPKPACTMGKGKKDPP